MICSIVSGGRLFRASLQYKMHQGNFNKSVDSEGTRVLSDVLLFSEESRLEVGRIDVSKDDRPNLPKVAE